MQRTRSQSNHNNHHNHHDEQLRLMVVDDSPEFTASLCRFIKDYNGLERIEVADNGQKALELAERVQPHLILLDFNLPDINGVQLAQALFARQPDLKIIMLSMNKGRHYVDAAARAGIHQYIYKPDAPEELFPAITRLMDTPG